MNQYKYTCLHCGQHIEYTDAYSGLQMPCPKCQQIIVFPGIAATKQTSSLRLAGAAARPPAKSRFDFGAIIVFLREFKHWKIVGMCLVPFVLVAGALVAASIAKRHEAAPVAAPPAEVVVDPHALDNLTDLTRADQLVQERVAAVNQAFAACQTAGQKPAACLALANARKAFAAAFDHYQKLGGTIDYRRQLP